MISRGYDARRGTPARLVGVWRVCQVRRRESQSEDDAQAAMHHVAVEGVKGESASGPAPKRPGGVLAAQGVGRTWNRRRRRVGSAEVLGETNSRRPLRLRRTQKVRKWKEAHQAPPQSLHGAPQAQHAGDPRRPDRDQDLLGRLALLRRAWPCGG